MRREIPEVLDELAARGEITQAQRQRIGEALERRLDAPRDHGGRVIAVVAALGGLLLAASVLSFVAYNWDALGKAAKLALIFGLWIGLHAAGYALAKQPGRSPRVGRALTLTGMLCFGAALALVAQIYNLSAHYPWALLLWWLLDVPLWLWQRTRAAQAVVTGLFLVWVFWHANVWYEDEARALQSWRYEVHCWFHLGLALSALLAALAALTASLRAERWSGLWRWLALPGVLLAGFLASFHDFGVGGIEFHPLLLALTPALCVLGLALLLLVAAWLRGLRGALRDEALAVLLLAALFTSLGLFAHEALPLVGNLLLLAAILALVWQGTRTRSAAQVNLALGFFALLIVARYLEYCWEKLQGAYAFLGAGALLLCLGFFLERRRRALMLRVRGGAA